ncbi:hypothetical protein CC80DRAFT_590338 [Byssothecium circinans]|uniref:Heterokaryon incompatibility domain-containing protein n=1 Tax=Byssothecium circinans TaxID=147558 RepID=A0A6A5U5N8_9PLEO|nr:hypothetical protein CC80DRAFT_590338 [Byssothecium circinans]
MKEGIDVATLARTINEAIQITRALGVRYLWIDSLCIVQGVDGDFQGPQWDITTPYPEQLLDAEFQGRPNSTIFGNSIWRVVPKALWDEQVLSASLNTRGWVFQDGLPQPLDTGSTDRYWRRKLQDSSDLNTFIPTVVDISLEDKLIAIWGIASFLIGALRETYGMGLWERNLEEQLAWHMIPGGASSIHQDLIAPTWSWARINGVIELPDKFAAVRDYQVAGHDGKRVAFHLEEWWHKDAEPQGPRTWKEQLDEYSYRLKKMDGVRQTIEVGKLQDNDEPVDNPKASLMPPPPGAIPQLSSPHIAIQGHIGSALMRRVRSVAGWTFEMHLLPVSGANIDVFPDIDPIDRGAAAEKFVSTFGNE